MSYTTTDEAADAPFSFLAEERVISRMGTATPSCSPLTYTFLDAGSGDVVKADVGACPEFPFVEEGWGLSIRKSFPANKKAASQVQEAASIKTIDCLSASLRWNYPDQVIRVVFVRRLSAVRLP